MKMAQLNAFKFGTHMYGHMYKGQERYNIDLH